MKHAHIGLVALAAVLVAGCGGGSNNKTNGEEGADAPKPFDVVLPLGHGLSGAGEIEIEAGESKTTGSGAVLSCPASAGDDGCVVTVKVADAALGTFTATSTGGLVTVAIPKDPEVERLERERDTAISERDTARSERDSARSERDTARTERDTARTERDEETERANEETERADKAEDEAEGAGNQLRQNNARRVLAGLNPGRAAAPVPTQGGGETIAVTPRFRATALVTPSPALSTPTTTPGSNGKWFRTSISDSDFATTDRLDVYSDVEAPKGISFRESDYNDGVAASAIINTDALGVAALYNPSDSSPTAVIDSTDKVVGSVLISAGTAQHTRVSGVDASVFPKSTDAEKTFAVVDRGFYTKTAIDAGKKWYELENDNDPGTDPLTVTGTPGCPCKSTGYPVTPTNASDPETFRDDKRYPLRWTYETPGSIAGARGTFTCASGSGNGPAKPADPNICGVTNQNNHFSFNGPWVFTPDSGAQIQLDDAEYMYFGWWARQLNPNNSAGTWTFHTFHGPATGGNRSTEAEIARLSGPATYKGVAAGYYSFFQPLDSSSDYGEFTATATLRANFTETGGSLGGDETVSGTIDNFRTINGNREGRPDWIVTLKQTTITGSRVGTVGGGAGGAGVEALRAGAPVSWKIEGEAVSAPDAGEWEAAFYSNLPAAKRGGTGAVNQEDATPAGIAGTFEAEYHNVGKMVGAFGAHKE